MSKLRTTRVVTAIACALALGHSAIAATFDNATFTSDYNVQSDTFVNGLTLSAANLNIDSSNRATFSGSQAIGGSGAIVLAGNGSINLAATAGSIVTLNSGITLRTGTGVGTVTAPIINFGIVSAQTLGATLLFNSLDNRNAVSVTNGKLSLGSLTNSAAVTLATGDLVFTGAVNNTAGSIVQNGGRIFFAGTTPTAGLANFTRNAGTLEVNGTLDNTGNTFNLNTLGQVQLTGTLKGGTFTGTGNPFSTATGTPTLDGVTLGSSMSYTSTEVSGPTINVANGLTLASGTTFTLNTIYSSGLPTIPMAMSFTGSQTLAGSGTLVFDNKTARVAASTGTLTIAPGITIRTGTGDAALGSTTANLNNQGTIRVTSGRSMWVGGTTVTNTGTIEVESGGSLHLGGTINFASYGTINRPVGANMFMAGSVANTGNTFDFGNTPYGVMNFGGGNISGGTVVSSAGEIRVVPSPGDNTATLFNTTLDADLAVEAGAELVLANIPAPVAGRKIRLTGFGAIVSSPGNSANVGEIVFDGTPAPPGLPGASQYVFRDVVQAFTMTSGTIRTGTGGGTIGNSSITTLTNKGTLSAQTAGQTLGISAPSLVNAGTLAVSAGTFGARQTTIFNDGAINVSGGLADFVVALTNRSTGIISVSGGVLSAGLEWSNAGSISVTGAGTFRTYVLPASYGNLAINGGTLELLLATSNTTSAKVKQFTANNATLALTNNGGIDNTGDTFTLSPTWFNTLRLAGGQGIVGGTLVGNPTAKIINAEAETARLAGVTLNNEIEANAVVAIANGLTLGSGATLTMRTTATRSAQLSVTGNQTISGTGSIVFTGTGPTSVFTNNPNITWTIAPGVTLRNDGVDASINSTGSTLQNQGKVSSQSAGKTITLRGTSVTNSGTLEARDGGKLSLLSTAFENTGTLFVGSGSTLTTTPTITGTGTIAGSGKIIGNASAGGNVQPGESPGVLEITGNFTFQPSATLYIELGATTIDQLMVSGAAALDGTLNVTLAGRSPQVGDQYQFIQAGSFTGGFLGWSLPALSNGQWDTSQLSQGLLSVGVPEPTSMALLALASPIFLRRRRFMGGTRCF